MSIDSEKGAKQPEQQLQRAKLNWASLLATNDGWDSGSSSPGGQDGWAEQLQQLEINETTQVNLTDVKIPKGAVLGYQLDGKFIPLARRQPEVKNKKR